MPIALAKFSVVEKTKRWVNVGCPRQDVKFWSARPTAIVSEYFDLSLGIRVAAPDSRQSRYNRARIGDTIPLAVFILAREPLGKDRSALAARRRNAPMPA